MLEGTCTLCGTKLIESKAFRHIGQLDPLLIRHSRWKQCPQVKTILADRLSELLSKPGSRQIGHSWL